MLSVQIYNNAVRSDWIWFQTTLNFWNHCLICDIISKSTIFWLFKRHCFQICETFTRPDHMNSGSVWLLAALPWRLQAAHLFCGSPMGGGRAFQIQRISVRRWQVQRQYTIVRLPEIHFTASVFFLKIFTKIVRLFVFVCFVVFLFVFFFCLFFFFANLHEKQNKSIGNKQKSNKTHFCVEVVSDYHGKRA